MKKAKHKIENIFGPIGNFSGIIVFIAGVIMLFSSLAGFMLIMIGAFVGFSFSGTTIDFDNKRIKYSNHIFGIIEIGKWVDIKSNMQIGMIRKSTNWRAYSQSNRSISVDENDLRLVLYDEYKNQIMPIQKLKSLEKAETELEKLCLELGLKRITKLK